MLDRAFGRPLVVRMQPQKLRDVFVPTDKDPALMRQRAAGALQATGRWCTDVAYEVAAWASEREC